MRSRHVLLFVGLLVLAGCADLGFDSPTGSSALALRPSDHGSSEPGSDDAVATVASAAEAPGHAGVVIKQPGRLRVRNIEPVTMTVTDFQAVSDGAIPARYLSFKAGAELSSKVNLRSNIDVTLQIAMEFEIDRILRRGRMTAVAQFLGDANLDGEFTSLRRSFSGDVQLILREDEILGVESDPTLHLVANGGGRDIQWLMKFSWTEFMPGRGDRGGIFKLETLGVSCGPIMTGD